MAIHWQYGESFGDTNLKMFENKDLCDVTLSAGNMQKEIKCHKFILASRSPVFYAMFCGALAESKDVICIPDIEPSTLENVLRYLYSCKVEINDETALSLLYAAQKYDMPGLESQCKLFLDDNIEAENVCIILDQAILFDDEDLKVKSLDFIMDKSEGVLKSDAFVQMSKSGLQEVLKLEPFNASECKLYAACKRWATQRCRDAGKQENDANIRQELGDELIYLIRFPTMTLEEFEDVVASTQVLSYSELRSVYQSIENMDTLSKFISKPRPYLSVTKFEFVCCKSTRNDGYLPQNVLRFTVSKDCELRAVDLRWPLFRPTDGYVTGVLEILDGSTVIHTQNVMFDYNTRLKRSLVNLDKRRPLKSMKEYSIRQRMHGRDIWFSSNYEPIITMEGVTLTLSNLTNGPTDNRTNVSMGPFLGFHLGIFKRNTIAW